MSTCLSDEALAAWAAGELAAAEQAGALDHVASCASCGAILGGVFFDGERTEPATTTLGRYRVVGTVAAGGMGVILRADDPVLARQVALKMANAGFADPAHRARMLAEAQALARLSHPNVVTVHDYGEAGDEVFVAMELVEGPMLRHWLAESPSPSLAARSAVLLGVGGGLAAIHAAGLVHRDIKPENVVVRADGTGVIVDFGLARPVGVAGGSAAGSLVAGTPHYLAPELACARASAAATATSDQYAWWRVVEEALREAPLGSRRRAVDALIARGTADDPAARFADQSAATAALAAALAPRRRRWPWLVAAAVVVVAAAGGTAYALWPRPAASCAAVPAAEWTPARRAQIAAALAATGVAPERALAALDARAATTVELRLQACQAGRSQRLSWNRRLACLDESWGKVTQALAQLVPDKLASGNAALDELTAALPAERCLHGSLAAVPAALPPERARQVKELTDRINTVGMGARPAPERLAALRALTAEVEAVGHPPLTAALRWQIARAHLDARDRVAAGAEFELAARAGLAAGYDDLYVRSLISELQVIGMSATAAQVESLEQQAIAGAARLGNPQVDAQLLVARAEVRMERGDNTGAGELYQLADELFGKISLGPDAMHVGVLQNLGAAHLEAGDLDGAAATLDRAVALALARYGERGGRYWETRAARATVMIAGHDYAGAEVELRAVVAGFAAIDPGSGQIAMTGAYLCAALMSESKLDDARAACAASVTAMQAALGVDSPGQVWPLTLSGQVELRAHQPAAAVAFLRRAVVFAERGNVRPIETTVARGYLAIALLADHQTAEARALARRVAPLLVTPDVAEIRMDFVAAFPELSKLASPPAPPP